VKYCIHCGFVSDDDEEVCPNCGGNSFNHIVFPFYNNIEPYKEVGNGKEMDTESHKEARSPKESSSQSRSTKRWH